MRQIRLVSSGVQTWYKNVIGAAGDLFAFCSTMAIHLFDTKNMQLSKMLVGHERTITSIVWNPIDANQIAVSYLDGRIMIWNIETEEPFVTHNIGDKNGCCDFLDWSPTRVSDLYYVTRNDSDSEVYMLDVGSATSGPAGSTRIHKKEKNVTVRVLRCHPSAMGRVIIGLSDGKCCLFEGRSTSRKLQFNQAKGAANKVAVEDIQWDPLSTDFFLVCYADGCLALVDVARDVENHKFERQAQGITTMDWIRNQPGNFITASERMGAIKVWNVSQRSPIDQIKVGISGIACVKSFATHPGWVLTSFKNGSVGVLDMKKRKLEFESPAGHSETIFDVAFNPSDPNMLATAAYDGFVKLWNVATAESQRELKTGEDTLLYGVAFSPVTVQPQKVCAVSSTGKLYIWSAETGEEFYKLQPHSGSIYRVEWCPQADRHGQIKTDEWIITGGSDNLAVITDAATGFIKHRFKHPNTVYGVSLNPSDAYTLATACEDGKVRIWDTLTDHEAKTLPRAIMEGHTARVFNVTWNPVMHNVLASGSNDRKIIIWNTMPGSGQPIAEVKRLEGHTDKVRALLWHHELPHILFSGSWDNTIRVWNVAVGACIYIATEHHADVYGLACHPSRPFMLASSSRDTSLRFWSCDELAMPYFLRAVVRPERLGELVGSGPNLFEAIDPYLASLYGGFVAGALGSRGVLYGQGINQLLHEVMGLMQAETSNSSPQYQQNYSQSNTNIANISNRNRVLIFRKIVSFFLHRQGLEDIWDLVSNILNCQPDSINNSIFHENDVVAAQTSKAETLVSANKISIGIQARKEDRSQQAADIMMRVGNLRQYCENMKNAGNWEKAICIAPAVSLDYWALLSQQYAKHLGTCSADAAPHLAASGQVNKLIDYYLDRWELENAFIVSKVHADGRFPPSRGNSMMNMVAQDRTRNTEGSRSQLERVSAILSQRYRSQHQPVSACASFLAVSNVPAAVDQLIVGHEHVLAFVVEKLCCDAYHNPICLKVMALSAERYQLFDLAADIWKLSSSEGAVQEALLGARLQCLGVQLPPNLNMNISSSSQRVLNQQSPQILQSVCGNNFAEAAGTAINAMTNLFQSPKGWKVQEAKELLEPLYSIRLDNVDVKIIAKVLACAAYVGFIEAVYFDLREVILPLAQTYKNIVTSQGLDLPMNIDELFLSEAIYRVNTNPNQAFNSLDMLLTSNCLSSELQGVCRAHLDRCEKVLNQTPGSKTKMIERTGRTVLTGVNLPAGSVKTIARPSVLTNTQIRGPAFCLEDGRQYISLSEALAWGMVNRFSPLNTGAVMTSM